MGTGLQPSLDQVDWSKIPVPIDDGAGQHLAGLTVPDITLQATDGRLISLAALPGRTVVYAYPWTGRPGVTGLVENWDAIPGARGCTPQSCSFRDHFAELRAAGVSQLFGLSVQDTAYQREAADRLHLPFALLSDERLELADALRLPTIAIGAVTLLKRLTMVIDGGCIAKVFYPVFPPDRNAADVLEWLRANRA